MATPRVTLRQLKKRVEKIRITAALGPESYKALVLLTEKQPDLTISQIVGDCVRFANSNDMYNDRRGLIQVPQEVTIHKSISLVDKPTWCEKYGGKCDGINCTYNKYEVTASGNVVRNELTMPLRSMPETEADFQKSVLGGFITVNEAEIAFESQVAEEIFDPSEIPNSKATFER